LDGKKVWVLIICGIIWALDYGLMYAGVNNRNLSYFFVEWDFPHEMILTDIGVYYAVISIILLTVILLSELKVGRK
jgi:hypothetical protein